ncbi:MAG: hypothetical protein MJ217_00750 [Bacilli bacterium]|nr:hypothetical protein [Bacilli bacterium]
MIKVFHSKAFKKYSFVSKEDEKEEVLFESSDRFTVLERKHPLIDKLNNKEDEIIIFKSGDEIFSSENTFTIIVNVRNVEKFNFVFKDKEFDLEKIKSDLLVLKDLDDSTDELKIEKLQKMFAIFNEAKPLFGYVLEYVPLLDNFNFSKNKFPFLMEQKKEPSKVWLKIKSIFNKKQKPEDQNSQEKSQEIEKPKKENKFLKNALEIVKNIDNWLSLFSALLTVVSGAFLINLFDEKNSLGTVFIILLIAYICFDIYLIYLSHKVTKESKILDKSTITMGIFSLVGTAAGFGIFILLATFVRKLEKPSSIWLYVCIGMCFAIIFTVISTVVGYYVSKLNKKKIEK